MHVPGIKVMPATPADAKGLLIGAVRDNNPVMFIDDRWCYDNVGEVPDNLEAIELEKAEILREGSDLSIIAYSYLVDEALKASSELEGLGISAEVINLRSIKPWDKDSSKFNKKNKKAIICDTDGLREAWLVKFLP